MTLLIYEWRKLARLAALWGFLALCLAFNVLLVWERDFLREPFNEASAITKELGQRVDGAFLEGLEARPEFGKALLPAAREMTNIYQDYDLESLSAFYQNAMKEDRTARRLMERKYQRLSLRVERLAETGAAMDLYAGPVTRQAHQFLYGTLLRAVTAEAGILGMLSMLYLLDCEDQRRTVSLVCASRAGRRVYRRKVLAGLTAAVLLYALLAAASLAVYFVRWDYGGVWTASVSSQFNYLTNMLVKRPFFTWADFTVAGYLAASLALGAALTAAFSLLASLAGMLLRNAYLPALALAVYCLGCAAAVSALAEGGLWTAAFALSFQPVAVWMAASGWFTELGSAACVPWQECAAVGVSLLAFGAGTALALRRFERKDLMK